MTLLGMNLYVLLTALLGGYLLGSVPFGLLLTRTAGLGDVRKIGSGNIGATNVLRTGRKDLALATLVLDAGKAMVAVAAMRAFVGGPEGDDAGAIAGAAAFLGHLFPVWLGFKGGKGVATFFGTMLVIAWPVGAVAAVIWLGMAAVFRRSSLSSLTAAALTPVVMVVFGEPRSYLGVSLFVAVLIFYRHQANIERLLKGEEPKIGASKASAAPPEPANDPANDPA
ncbi:MAG: glycerol-3-phosphate 1-O-acyltransferase PlsY [Pseudomonadota bacterium]|jgi:glycerol-3-phosphate acyltransferase PlsY